ncbi:hypothetical protein TCAL_02722 [Tigriopus californicus]|uniref:N-acetyltransferase domain-containing protein n=1 Tax=Tigriopus californicus TaxID=6832 RepID=A0A553NQA2_TIGCA|nr:uncharacterized protein LOC131879530 [Tigriopus californicus]TRY67615.1 hypothetical protein TCAL_02722 [Tigriopus californicus]|eukprot:TCALIF_02722-PA protein Name:"Protein of unknown function" AED:0.00 eAED:0.00 QI:56/1/1/1/1/1/3/723/164
MQISKAEASDVQSIFDVVNEAYQVESGNEHLAFKNVTRFRSLDEAAAKLEATWVLKDETEQVVGVLVAVVEKEEVDIGPIAVRKSIKGKGMGKMLLTFAESLAPTSVVWVVSCRADLFPWYIRNGYVEVKRIPVEDHIPRERLTRKNLEMVCMKKAGKGKDQKK